jgi:hypothetical protein
MPHKGQVKVTIEQMKGALSSTNSVEEACKIAGCSLRTMRERFQVLGLGRPSTWLGEMRAKGTSTRRDGAGNTEQEWHKTERKPDPTAFKPSPPDFSVERISTGRDREGQVLIQWTRENKKEAAAFEQFWKAAKAAASEIPSLPRVIAKRKDHRSDLLSLYPLGDPHLGMLAWMPETGADFDLKIATRELYACVDMLVDSAPPSKVGVLASLGDLFHAEDDFQVTPRQKHKLDVDTRSEKVNEAGFELVERMVLRLLQKHEIVEIVLVPGNHDPKLARMLRLWCLAVFRKNRRVKVLDNRDPYIYIRWGKTLLGFCHRDGAKDGKLLGIMANDQRKAWGESDYCYWHGGHHHQDGVIELPGCVIEQHQTLAPRDYYAHHAGFRSGRGLKVITYSNQWGFIARNRVDIQQVHARLANVAR